MASLTKAELAAYIPMLYGTKIFEEAQAMSFWAPFEGEEGSGLPIVVKTELEREPGDTIRIAYTKQLVGAGRVAEEVLEGYEEKLRMDYCDVDIALLRHATRHQRTASEQNIIDLAGREKTALAKWLSRKLDEATFTEATTNPTNVLYADVAAADSDDLDGTDVMDTGVISRARVMADDLQFPPMTVINGIPYYGLVIHTYQAYDLKQDSVWQNAQREAMPPGMDNPLFTGMLGHWDGVVLFSHPRVPVAANAASSAVNIGDAVLFGSEFMAHAYGRAPEYIVETFDYKESLGTGIAIVQGMNKLTFDSVDKSVLTVRTACEDPNA
jgi:N4-gp56 family major capsid protein